MISIISFLTNITEISDYYTSNNYVTIIMPVPLGHFPEDICNPLQFQSTDLRQSFYELLNIIRFQIFKLIIFATFV